MDENVYDLNSSQVSNQDGSSVDLDDVPVSDAPTQAKQDPDPATAKRIGSLGMVGTALMQRANDNSFQTEYMVAQDSLTEFEEGIAKLNLDPQAEQGMKDLITYLRTKLQKRLKSSIDLQPLQ